MKKKALTQLPAELPMKHLEKAAESVGRRYTPLGTALYRSLTHRLMSSAYYSFL
jgi:hypothetical protein